MSGSISHLVPRWASAAHELDRHHQAGGEDEHQQRDDGDGGSRSHELCPPSGIPA